MQYEVAQAEARTGAARALVLSELGDIWQEVVATQALGIANRLRIRLATTFAIHEAKAAAEGAEVSELLVSQVPIEEQN